MTRTTKFVVTFFCVHVLLAATCLLWSFSASMREFDGGAEQSTVDRGVARAADVLFLPASLVWTRWASENLPNAFEWLLFLANSTLWGLALGLLVGRVIAPMRAT